MGILGQVSLRISPTTTGVFFSGLYNFFCSSYVSQSMSRQWQAISFLFQIPHSQCLREHLFRRPSEVILSSEMLRRVASSDTLYKMLSASSVNLRLTLRIGCLKTLPWFSLQNWAWWDDVSFLNELCFLCFLPQQAKIVAVNLSP